MVLVEEPIRFSELVLAVFTEAVSNLSLVSDWFYENLTVARAQHPRRPDVVRCFVQSKKLLFLIPQVVKNDPWVCKCFSIFAQ